MFFKANFLILFIYFIKKKVNYNLKLKIVI